MKISISQKNFETFVFKLLKKNHQAKTCYDFLLSSDILIKDDTLKDILRLHSQLKFKQSYSKLIRTELSQGNFYSKLASLLLSYEEYQIVSLISSLNDNYNCATNAKINFFYKAPHREEVYINFNIDYNKQKRFNDDEMIIKEIINLLEYYKYIDIDNYQSSYLNLLIFDLLNKGNVDKGQSAYYRSIKKFFEDNKIFLEGEKDDFKIMSNISYSFSNNYNNSNEENSKINDESNDELTDKLNYIYESINGIDFDNTPHIQIQNCNEIKEEEEKSQGNKSLFYNESDDFILKLKAFTILKKYYQKRKAKKGYLLKKERLIEMANNFYRNLLYSRVLYGFELITRRKANYELLKNHFIDLRISELSKFIIEKMKYFYELKKKENFITKGIEIIKKRKIFEVLKNKLNYKKNYNKFLLSQIMNNQFALDFILFLCDKAKNRIRTKSSFATNYEEVITRKALNRNEEYCRTIFDLLKRNKDISTTQKIKVREISKFIYQHGFFSRVKEELHYKSKIGFLFKKLFFMRYYIMFYKKQQKLQIYEDKKNKVKSMIMKRNFNSLLNIIRTKKEHNKKIDDIISETTSKSLKSHKKISFTYNRYDNSQNRKANALEIYNVKLKQKGFALLLDYHNMNKKIFNYREKIVNKEMDTFFKRSKIKTIESLIVQGIKEKIKNYQKLYFFQVLFYSSFSKMKLEKGMENRERNLQKKGFNLLKDNVQINYKIIKQNLKFYFKYFTLLIPLQKSLHQSTKNKYMKLYEKFVFNVFIKKIYIKKAQKMQMKSLKGKFISNSFKESARLFLNKNKKTNIDDSISKNRRIYSKTFFKQINKSRILTKLSKRQKSINKIKIWNRFVKSINNSIIINSLQITSHKLILRNAYIHFIDNINSSFTKSEGSSKLNSIYKKYLAQKLIDTLIISSKTKSIMDDIYTLYETKLKKKIFNEYKKRYLDNIKFSMLSCRYKEYLVLTSMNKFSIAMKKAHS